MKLIITKPAEAELTAITCDLGVRYFEDAKVNGEHDDPCNPAIHGAYVARARHYGINGHYWTDELRWKITIDPDTGVIEGWPEGMTANIHYKICDDCRIDFLCSDALYHYEGYVPSFLCIGDEGHGDYAIFSVEGDGHITDWKFSQKDFNLCVENNI